MKQWERIVGVLYNDSYVKCLKHIKEGIKQAQKMHNKRWENRLIRDRDELIEIIKEKKENK